jgi:hypothetical protein
MELIVGAKSVKECLIILDRQGVLESSAEKGTNDYNIDGIII